MSDAEILEQQRRKWLRLRAKEQPGTIGFAYYNGGVWALRYLATQLRAKKRKTR